MYQHFRRCTRTNQLRKNKQHLEDYMYLDQPRQEQAQVRITAKFWKVKRQTVVDENDCIPELKAKIQTNVKSILQHEYAWVGVHVYLPLIEENKSDSNVETWFE